jgi:LysR family nitrogen assimilation transcriptional regulator
VDTRHLRSFLKIAETGSISRAAESLRIAQPSLSQQLLKLEEELGASLFRRTTRGVTLTEAGRLFEEHARQLLSSTEHAIDDVRNFNAEASGEAILAVPYSISKLAGVVLAEAFMRHAPQVQFRLVEAMTGHIRGWLDASKIDLGILYDLRPLSHLSMRRLATEELYLIGPSNRFGKHEADGGAMPNLSMKELAGLPMFLPGRQHGLRQLIDQEAESRGETLTIRQEIDAIAHIGSLVAAGHGYSVLPLPAIADDLRAGRVSIARIEGGAVRRALCLVRNGSRVVTHASVRCEDLTLKVLASLIEKKIWIAESEVALR